MIFRTLMCLRRFVVVALLGSSFCSAGTIHYEFTAGSKAPTVTDLPAGVQAGDFVIGSGFGNLFDQDGSPDSLRITGSDGPPDTTGASFTAKTVFTFTLTIPADRAVDLQTLSLRYKSTNVNGRSNARVFSTIRGHLNPTADTIGLVGNGGAGTDANFVTSTVPLFTPSQPGANIQPNDFRGLTNRTVTFEIPWMDVNTTATQFIDLDDVTLTFTEVAVPGPVTPTTIANFEVLADRTARISIAGQENTPFYLLASPDLAGPTYRKSWALLTNGTFVPAPTVFTDGDADDFTKRFYLVAPSLPKAKIMPVGDSITDGAATFSVYRLPLATKLSTAGYRFEYVGSKTTNGGLPHEGYGGENATQIAVHVAAAAPVYKPDIVLIHSGHNFDLNNESESAIIGKIETATRSMIASARSANPKVSILLAQVITSTKVSENNPNVVKYGYIPALNIRLAQVAAELNTPAQLVIIVNQAEGWNTPTDAINDQVHPTAAGAEKMATKWFAGLQPLLE